MQFAAPDANSNAGKGLWLAIRQFGDPAVEGFQHKEGIAALTFVLDRRWLQVSEVVPLVRTGFPL